MNQTGIIWTEVTWNPMSGCQKVSAGCKYCYASTLAESKRGSRSFPNGFDLTIREHKLIEPFKLKEPTLIFVNSMSDLFWDKVPDEYRHKILDVMEKTPQHEYQVLTKRPDLMLAFSKKRKLPPNFWAGVSVEDEKAKSRIEILKQVDTEIRFISMEPMLGKISLKDDVLEGIHWVITGGESGKHLLNGHICEERGLVRYNPTKNLWEVREDREPWIREIRDFCIEHHVKYFHKQWGGEKPESAGRLLDGKFWTEIPKLPGGQTKIQNKYLEAIENSTLGNSKKGITASKMNSSEDVIEFSSEEEELINSYPVNETSIQEDKAFNQTPNVESNNYDNVKFGKDLLAIPFNLMMENFKTRPKEKMLWGNIKENSVGLIVGPSGAGKSIMSENLAMSLASGYNNYLGLPILSEGGKVILSISLEESCNPRTERNIKQIERVNREKGKEWMNRWYVIDDRMPQFLTTDQEFGILHNLIETIKPDVLIIDSLTHLCNGPIEDSTVCSKLMKRVRGLAKGRNCTPIVIHHIPKINDAPLTIHSVAGSRVVGQEVDFVIGINSLSNGKKYLKMVKSRYVRDTTKVISFTIDDDCWLKVEGEMDEQQILATVDGRFDFNNKEKIFDFIVEELENGNDDVEFSQIKEKLVDTQEMSLQTAHTQLNSLIKEKRIIKGGHGRYKLPD